MSGRWSTTDDTMPWDSDDPIDAGDADGGALEDAGADAMDRWARRYDDLNGAPENEEDR